MARAAVITSALGPHQRIEVISVAGDRRLGGGDFDDAITEWAVQQLRTEHQLDIQNDRGAFTAVARVEDSIREGVVWAPSIWWGKFATDGANANQTTSQRETDLGHGPVFYDNLVEVSLAD